MKLHHFYAKKKKVGFFLNLVSFIIIYKLILPHFHILVYDKVLILGGISQSSASTVPSPFGEVLDLENEAICQNIDSVDVAVAVNGAIGGRYYFKNSC